MINPEDFEFRQLRRFRLWEVLGNSLHIPTSHRGQFQCVTYTGIFYANVAMLVSTVDLGYRIPSSSASQQVSKTDDTYVDRLWTALSYWAKAPSPSGSYAHTSDGSAAQNDLFHTTVLAITIQKAVESQMTYAESVDSPGEGTIAKGRLHTGSLLGSLHYALALTWNARSSWDNVTVWTPEHSQRLAEEWIACIHHGYRGSPKKALRKLLNHLSDQCKHAWDTYISGNPMVVMDRIVRKRKAWAIRTCAMFRRHVLAATAVGDYAQVKLYIEQVLSEYRSQGGLFISDEKAKPIPLLIDQTGIGDLTRPGSPTSLIEPRRSPSISTDYFRMRGSPTPDENASVRGLMSPRSVRSERTLMFAEAEELADYRAAQDGKHLVVFVHGLLGSAYDFRQYRNKVINARLNMGIPADEIMFLNSDSNEEDTFDDISMLADNLVKEIMDFVESNLFRVGRLSFVCHSLGGLIARCAVEKPAMAVFRDKLDTFTTFGTPHQGIDAVDNKVLGFVANAYRYLDRSPALDQLLLRDADDKRQCLLYKLATESTALQQFRTVRLFGGAQDGYAGLASALMVERPRSNGGLDNSRSSVVNELSQAGDQGWLWTRCAPICVALPCVPLGSGQHLSPVLSPLTSPLSPAPAPFGSFSSSTTHGDTQQQDSPLQSNEIACAEMLVGLTRALAATQAERYVAWFPALANRRDLLGRLAHVAFLEDPMFLEVAAVLANFHLAG
ncbi:putative serine esterase-domain-containing protein [Fimicolochytrium jonesii]|uniref:putative serine esterase-domain-containing protein n=1 Tax=Fimicolochytrium jonesii TaxID=1396493 RepID=UPI0022FF08DC|nr:putative serine esterase-domain-containing protein [Fimicolochytrium jonesii]KAI8826933.1 putative serine esterase-domain-containing protein [Fimicolochytrium jonesii]